MSEVVSDMKALEDALREVERRAAGLPWAKQRRWRVGTHTTWEGGWPVIDLHDLSVKLGIAVLDALEKGDVAAARLVTGGGRHTGGHSKLREAILAEARSRGWRVSPVGRARLEVVRDEGRVPSPWGLLHALWRWMFG